MSDSDDDNPVGEVAVSLVGCVPLSLTGSAMMAENGVEVEVEVVVTGVVVSGVVGTFAMTVGVGDGDGDGVCVCDGVRLGVWAGVG